MYIVWELGEEWVNAIFGVSSRLHPFYILSFLVFGFCLYLMRRPKLGFISWMFPADIYKHTSHMVDIKLLAFGSVLKVGGILNTTIIMVIMIYYTQELFGKSEAVTTPLTPFLIGFTLLLVGDFCTYWIHRIHHEWKVIWPFHAVHHSAEVMTPLTTYRKHPFYDFFSKTFKAVVLGFAQGIILSLLVGKISIFLIAGSSGFYFVFNALGSNFRHSHIWLSYGSVLEHIFISPAQHQIHHSLAHKHWNKNYGEVFAFWDWMFGTLYVPIGKEELVFGLSDIQGRRIEQPYPTLTDALCKPVRESWHELSGQSKENVDDNAIGAKSS